MLQIKKKKQKKKTKKKKRPSPNIYTTVFKKFTYKRFFFLSTIG